MTKWIDEGRPVEADANGGTEEDFKYALNAECVKSYEQMAQIEAEISAGKSDVQIIDMATLDNLSPDLQQQIPDDLA